MSDVVRARRTHWTALLVLLSTIACEDSTGPGDDSLPVLAIVGGDQQIGEAGSVLPIPLSVLVTDGRGRALEDRAIGWFLVRRGGGVSSPMSRTGEDGIATIRRTLGGAGQSQTVARLIDEPGVTVRFVSISQVQGATAIAATSRDHGNHQTDSVLASLPGAFRVRILDHEDVPVAGVRVEWARVEGNGSLSSAFSSTDEAGIAEVRYTLGERSGPERVEAAVPGLPGSPVRFFATAVPGVPTDIAVRQGEAQLALLGSFVNYSVRVNDAYGNAVAGVPIEWRVTTGGGFIVPPDNETAAQSEEDPEPFALASHTVGPGEGEQSVTATAHGIPGTRRIHFVSTAVTGIVGVWSTVDCDPYWYYYQYYYQGGCPTSRFEPAEVVVGAGRTVGWWWDGVEEHDVVFEDDPSPPASSPALATGIHVRTFTSPGTYRYRCTLHSEAFDEGDTGIVTVVP